MNIRLMIRMSTTNTLPSQFMVLILQFDEQSHRGRQMRPQRAKRPATQPAAQHHIRAAPDG